VDTKTALLEIGLHENQIKVYLALLQMGEGNIHDIAVNAAVKRTTAYSILDVLKSKGLVTCIEKAGHRTYYAENPKKVLLYFKDRQQEIQSHAKKFEGLIPELSSIYNVSATKPKIRFYEGVEGLKQVFEETLLLKSGEEILAIATATLIHKVLGDEWVANYLEQRVAGKIKQKAIVEDSVFGREHQKNDKKENRLTRLVPKEKFPFANEINIFGNKVMIASFKDQIGVIIESADVVQTWKAIFELAWIGAEKYKNPSH
jgi:sugar-specific transcriptional regulator TrmB